MIIGEYSRMVKESDEFVVFVKNYKIDSIYGFVRIVFFLRLKSWMDVFFKVCLKFVIFDCGLEKCVLLYFNGEFMVFS